MTMRGTVVNWIVVVGVVCLAVSCRDSSPVAVPLNARARSDGRMTDQFPSNHSECIADTEQLPLQIFFAPKVNALDPKGTEYRGDYDEHAEQVWRLEHFRVVDDVFMTGTLTEGSSHLLGFDDDKARFYRRSQWICD